ncbi:hypothetical protein EJ04DRAFT_566062 [Polyplosphaeria fusca]|uniref:Uncharacterized protein n=1 Tax=Polyplosphaeria fusca TaxID=682080 RepID=A0A9P4QWD5_9PLEO|nr:hypothetical protein EJ04DRAFT_566062 [Polyplosphaeria fusca]
MFPFKNTNRKMSYPKAMIQRQTPTNNGLQVTVNTARIPATSFPRFSELPLEVRERVYEEYFLMEPGLCWCFGGDFDQPILQVGEATRREAFPALLRLTSSDPCYPYFWPYNSPRPTTSFTEGSFAAFRYQSITWDGSTNCYLQVRLKENNSGLGQPRKTYDFLSLCHGLVGITIRADMLSLHTLDVMAADEDAEKFGDYLISPSKVVSRMGITALSQCKRLRRVHFKWRGTSDGTEDWTTILENIGLRTHSILFPSHRNIRVSIEYFQPMICRRRSWIRPGNGWKCTYIPSPNPREGYPEMWNLEVADFLGKRE